MKNIKTEHKILRKITGLLLVLLLSGLSFSYAADDSKYEKNQKMPLEEVLKEVEKSTDYVFVFDNNTINTKQTVSSSGNNSNIRETLNDVLEDTDIDYAIIDNKVILKAKVTNPLPVVMQSGRVTGTIVDETGEPLIGVNISIKGGSTGTISDIDGNFSLEGTDANSILVISYIGYITQEIKADSQSLKIVMREDTQNLDEVVVVGYGTQAKKDITGSVAVVSAEALAETPVATFAEALQGKASGVHIQTSGAPGAETTIRIRGVGSLSSADPLVIVDGVANVSISSVNPNDIETFQVLKDAAATAIYGAQGANGVLIITTKQGAKEGKVNISYDGYVGLATMANSGFDLLNAWDAMEFQAYGMVNRRDYRGVQNQSHAQFGRLDANDQLTMPYAIKPSGVSRDQIVQEYGSVENWVASYKPNGGDSWSRSAYYQMLEDGYSEAEARKGTDWYDLITQKGFITSHQISVLGGGDRGSYALGAGYESREGTIKGSGFERFSFRANTTFNPNKYFSIGQNTNVSLMEWSGERGSQGDGNAFGRVYTTQPWIPVYNVGGDFAGSQANEGGRNLSAVHALDRQKDNWNRRFFIQNALFAEVKPIDGLTLRTQFSTRLGGTWNRTFNPIDVFANKEGVSDNDYSEEANYRLDWQWTNTVNYRKSFDDHNLQVLFGTEAIKNGLGREISGLRRSYIFEDLPSTWILDNGDSGMMENSGEADQTTTMFGFFGRVDYDYQSKYLTTLTVRRDGSSKFNPNKRWGTFPSISVGWRISSEDFMEKTRNWLEDLKIRAGYGTTGSSQIGSFNYAFQYETGSYHGYPMDGSDGSITTGYVLTSLGDLNAKWETTKMLNVGLDGTLLSNRLTFGLDYYIKKTSDMLVPANWSGLAGMATKPNINIGDMENKGFDMSLSWRDKVGAVSYDISANVSTYKNKVIKLGSADLFRGTRLNDITITTEGQPIGMFYGYKIDGVYTSVNDVLDYKTAGGETILPYAVSGKDALNPEDWVGRYKLMDVNRDGRVDAADRTYIGNPHPDFTGGVNIGLKYKGFDLAAYLYFSVGNDAFRHYMYYTHYGALQSNYSYDRWHNSWHPETNPNGKYPLWATSAGEGTEAANNSNSSYIQDASYLRMQTLTLGYTLPKSITQKVQLQRVRIYGQVGNLFTITGYDGLDPEIRGTFDNNSPDRSRGVDYGSYGIPRTFLLGVNVGF